MARSLLAWIHVICGQNLGEISIETASMLTLKIYEKGNERRTLQSFRTKHKVLLFFRSLVTISVLLARDHRLNIELDLQSLFGLHVHSCTHWLRPRNPPPPPINERAIGQLR